MNKKSVQIGEKKSIFTNFGRQNSAVFFPVKKTILGIGVTDASEEKILESVVNFIEKSVKNAYIVTPNPEMVVESTRNFSFKTALNGADLALCDGVGLFFAGQLTGSPLKSRIIGTNFVGRLCEKVSDRPITVGFLGGRPGIAVSAAECLKKKYPKLLVGFAEENWGGLYQGPASTSPSVSAPSSRTSFNTVHAVGSLSSRVSLVQKNKPLDILFVAFGHPKQELWMAEHIDKIPVRVIMGVGGAFDQIVDSSLRAPSIVNSIGMGWLYRLIRQPWRIKRQLALVTFTLLVCKAILSGQKK
ncbi:MAG: WecB/TagA/CpsF family glycosyltransferase [Patescibacteria group bacterium]|nr:WecB/TagA/CpsF family glycosyltransferase [Patescibacteria group bacterium]